MPIFLIDKIKQKNNGAFKLVDSVDISVEGNTDLQAELTKISANISKLQTSVSQIPKFSIEVVDELPVDNISETTVYLVKDFENPGNLYTEYVYINGSWELLGHQELDLSPYLTIDAAEQTYAKKTDVKDSKITITQNGNSKGSFTLNQNSPITIDIDDTTYNVASASEPGLVKIGYLENSKNYPVKLDIENKMYVNVPWTDTIYSHPAGSAPSKVSGLYKFSTDENSHILSTENVTKEDITKLGIPAQDTTYSLATSTENGLMSSADKSKLDTVETNANNYIHPETPGNKHIPAGGLAGQFLKWSSNGVAVWSNDNDTKYSAGAGLELLENTFSVKYGSGVNTACQGNDSRLSDSRPADGGSADTLKNLDATIDELNYLVGTTSNIQNQINSKQDTLISGTNIKTINGKAILGNGNIQIDVPTKVSQLTNDSGYITASVNNLSNYYNKSEVDGLIPKTNYAMNNKNYPVKLDSNSNMYVNVPWTDTITPETDLSNYYNKDEIKTELAKKQDKLTESNFKTVNGVNVFGAGNIQIDVPTKVSQLTNDSGYITNSVSDLSNYYNKIEVNNLISKIEVVEELPGTGKENTMYLVTDTSGSGNDNYKEYIWNNGKWEKLGDGHIELSQYALKTEVTQALSDAKAYTNTKIGEVNTTLNNYVTKENLSSNYTNTTDLNALLEQKAAKEHKHTMTDITDLSIPTKVSELENDSKFMTRNDHNADNSALKSAIALKANKNELAKYATTDSVNASLAKKQDKLVSGTNIKTINGQSILADEGNKDIKVLTEVPLSNESSIGGILASQKTDEYNIEIKIDNLTKKLYSRENKLIVESDLNGDVVLSYEF